MVHNGIEYALDDGVTARVYEVLAARN